LVEDLFTEAVSRPDAVFVKAETLPCSAVESLGVVAFEVEIRNPFLSRDRGTVKDGMLVFEFVMDFFWGDLSWRIDGNKVILVF
jgi:hypothetical protein